MTVSRFHIKGMDCAAEEQLVRMHLADLDAINQIVVDLDSRNVTIDHQRSTSDIAEWLQQLNLGAEHLDDTSELGPAPDAARERSTLIVAFVINAAFFVGELTIGLLSDSMGLVADALDMGADASVYALSLVAVGATAARKKQLARGSGYLQATLAVTGLTEVLRRVMFETELPDTTSMVVVSLLALAGNTIVLVLLQRVRTGEAHLQASWIFTANDIKVNALVIVAAVAVAISDSAVPDLIAGAIIFLIVANGARRILNISR